MWSGLVWLETLKATGFWKLLSGMGSSGAWCQAIECTDEIARATKDGNMSLPRNLISHDFTYFTLWPCGIFFAVGSARGCGVSGVSGDRHKFKGEGHEAFDFGAGGSRG